MLRKMLFLASLPLMATPFISQLATPATATSLYSQEKSVSQLESASFSNNSVLISDRHYGHNDDRDYRSRDYRDRDYRNRDYRNWDYRNRDYRNRDYRSWYYHR